MSIEREIRLESIVKNLTESNDTIEALRKIISPYDEPDLKFGGQDPFEYQEENIFNELRLYKALGKDDARTVLNLWRRFTEICEVIRLAPNNK